MSETNRQAVTAKISEIATRIGEPEGLEIVEVQVLGGGKARLVRIYIDKPDGVSHHDCALISDRVGVVLDEENVLGEGAYTLEVSSPGVERKLSKAKDFERFTGQKVKIGLREAVEGKNHWEGILAGFSKGVVSLEPAEGTTIEIPLERIEKANLKFEW